MKLNSIPMKIDFQAPAEPANGSISRPLSPNVRGGAFVSSPVSQKSRDGFRFQIALVVSLAVLVGVILYGAFFAF